MVNTEPITTYLFTQGVLGVACVVLALVCIYLSKKVDKKDQVIADLQTLRVQDFKDTTKEVTGVLQDNSQNIRILSEKIVAGKSEGHS